MCCITLKWHGVPMYTAPVELCWPGVASVQEGTPVPVPHRTHQQPGKAEAASGRVQHMSNTEGASTPF